MKLEAIQLNHDKNFEHQIEKRQQNTVSPARHLSDKINRISIVDIFEPG